MKGEVYRVKVRLTGMLDGWTGLLFEVRGIMWAGRVAFQAHAG